MKQLIASLAIVATLTLGGCSNLYNSTPEFFAVTGNTTQDNYLGVSHTGQNCEAFSQAIAAKLIEFGADPCKVWLVKARIPNKGFVWVNYGNGWYREKAQYHQIVIHEGMAYDNQWGVVPVKELEWEYDFTSKMNMEDQQWRPI